MEETIFFMDDSLICRLNGNRSFSCGILFARMPAASQRKKSSVVPAL
jgi:hypothetical protein